MCALSEHGYGKNGFCMFYLGSVYSNRMLNTSSGHFMGQMNVCINWAPCVVNGCCMPSVDSVWRKLAMYALSRQFYSNNAVSSIWAKKGGSAYILGTLCNK